MHTEKKTKKQSGVWAMREGTQGACRSVSGERPGKTKVMDSAFSHCSTTSETLKVVIILQTIIGHFELR